MPSRPKFWLKNPSILLKDYYRIVPNLNAPINDTLNVLSRLLIYFIIFGYIFKMKNDYMITAIFLLSIIILLYTLDVNDNTKPNKVLENTGIKTNNSDGVIGHYDFNGDLVFSEPEMVLTDKTNEGSNNIYTYEELREFEKNNCQRPTTNNPFMNKTIYDYNSGNIPKACNLNDDEVLSEVQMRFDETMYKNMDERFSLYNTRRQFYTKPTNLQDTNTTKFAQWLYGVDKTCKTDNECFKYDDLRHNKKII